MKENKILQDFRKRIFFVDESWNVEGRKRSKERKWMRHLHALDAVKLKAMVFLLFNWFYSLLEVIFCFTVMRIGNKYYRENKLSYVDSEVMCSCHNLGKEVAQQSHNQ